MARTITTDIRRAARAFRIWQYCRSAEWNCSIPEVAEALGLSVDTVRGLCVARNWTARMRATRTDRRGLGRNNTASEADDDLVAMMTGQAA